jgi:hypothetical protein
MVCHSAAKGGNQRLKREGESKDLREQTRSSGLGVQSAQRRGIYGSESLQAAIRGFGEGFAMAIMSKALTGALLSGLVVPGLGQIVLKHYKRGVVLMLTVLVCLAVVVMEAVQQAIAVLDQIEAVDGTVSTSTISSAVHQASTSSDSRLIKFALLCMLFCWIIGAVDAYRIGRKLDEAGDSRSSLAQGKRDPSRS